MSEFFLAVISSVSCVKFDVESYRCKLSVHQPRKLECCFVKLKSNSWKIGGLLTCTLNY